jgi:hypothetical protein
MEGTERNVYLHAQGKGIQVNSITPTLDSVTIEQVIKVDRPALHGWDSLPAKVRIPVLIFGLLIGMPAFIALLLCAHLLWDHLTRSIAPDAPVSGTTFAEFDSKFSTESQNTDVQKDQMIAQYKGTRVRWQGILENVDGDMADFQEKATTLTHDVALEVADDEKSKLTGLSKGDLVTYEGTIVDYGALLAHRLDQGRIVDSKHLSGDERVTWLANSQTDALQSITGKTNTPTPTIAPIPPTENDIDNPQTIQQKAAWVRRHPGGEAFTGTDEDLAHLYDNMKRAVGN